VFQRAVRLVGWTVGSTAEGVAGFNRSLFVTGPEIVMAGTRNEAMMRCGPWYCVDYCHSWSLLG
jgi:hypothetical protein